jgi:hypothetical protein
MERKPWSHAEASALALEKDDDPINEEGFGIPDLWSDYDKVKDIVNALHVQRDRVASLFGGADPDKLGYIQLKEAINHLLSAEFFLNLLIKEGE